MKQSIWTKGFWKSAGERAIKTFAQVFVSMVTVGQAFDEVTWIHVASVAGVAALLSVLTSVATGNPVPEPDAVGTFMIDGSDPNVDKFGVQLTDKAIGVENMKTITLAVDPNAKFPTNP